MSYRNISDPSLYHFSLFPLPPNYTWTEIKDFIRDTLQANPKWTDTSDVNPLHGYFKIAGRQEAERVYRHLVYRGINNHPINVWLYDISGKEAQQVYTNSLSGFPDRGLSLSMQTQLNINSVRPVLPISEYPSPLYNTPQYAVPCAGQVHYISSVYTTQPLIPASQPMALVSQLGQQQPVYRSGVNVTNGVIRTEKRGIFIHNLDYSTQSTSLQALLGTVSAPVSCDILYHENGRSKGAAKAVFSSKGDAQKAVELLNGAVLDGRPLSIRLDHEGEPVQESTGVTGPVIACGATASVS